MERMRVPASNTFKWPRKYKIKYVLHTVDNLVRTVPRVNTRIINIYVLAPSSSTVIKFAKQRGVSRGVALWMGVADTSKSNELIHQHGLNMGIRVDRRCWIDVLLATTDGPNPIHVTLCWGGCLPGDLFSFIYNANAKLIMEGTYCHVPLNCVVVLAERWSRTFISKYLPGWRSCNNNLSLSRVTRIIASCHAIWKMVFDDCGQPVVTMPIKTDLFFYSTVEHIICPPDVFHRQRSWN